MRVATILEASGGKEKSSCPNASSQMNYFEKLLVENGIERAYDTDADYIVYNSCSFDGDTLVNVKNTIGDLISLQKWEERHYKLIIVGCITKVYDFPDLEELDDVIVIKDNIWSKAVIDYILEREKSTTLDNVLNSKFHSYATDNEVFSVMNIEEGCVNKCSFCKTNYVNNQVKSLPYNQLLQFLKQKIRNGTKIIDFHGECLNLYGIDIAGKPLLHKLIHEISKEKGLVSIFLGEVTAQNMYRELLQEISTNPKCNSVTLQLESASNRILKSMNRHHTIEEYDDIEKTLIDSGTTISTILMSGYPGETYEDLDKTINYIRKRKIPVSGVCQYVDSELVPSHNLEQYSLSEKNRHSRYLVNAINDINLEIFNENIDKFNNSIVFSKYNDCIYTVKFAHRFALSTKKCHQSLDAGAIIEEAPRQFVKESKFASGKGIYKY